MVLNFRSNFKGLNLTTKVGNQGLKVRVRAFKLVLMVST